MRRYCFLALSLCLLAATAHLGCSTGPDTPDDEMAEDAPAFLEEIPSTSPYVVATLQPIPSDIVEPYVEANSSWFDSMQETLNRRALGQGTQTGFDRVMAALAGELSEVESLEDLEALGFSAAPQGAIYGIGWYPVARASLSDAEAFEEMWSRVEAEADLEPTWQSVEGIDFREYDVEGGDKIALAVTDDEVIMGMSQRAAFDSFVEYMLGLERPPRSMADVNVLQEVQTRHGFESYGVGFVDIERIASVMTGGAPGDEVTAELLEEGGASALNLPPNCPEEIMELVQQAPRAVFGYTELTSEAMELSGTLELAPELADEVSGLGASMPGYDSAMFDDALLSIGLGVDIQRAMDFAAERARRVNRDPYQCRLLRRLNYGAQQGQQARAFLPPFVTNIRGLTALVADLEVDDAENRPRRLDALALVDTSDPGGLFAQLQQFVSQLRDVQLQPDSQPVQLEGLGAGINWVQSPHAAMDDDTLAASVGTGMQDELAALIGPQGTEQTAADTPLFALQYDAQRVLEEVQGLQAGRMRADAVPDDDALDLFRAMGFEIDATSDGISVRLRGELAPEQRAGAESVE